MFHYSTGVIKQLNRVDFLVLNLKDYIQTKPAKSENASFSLSCASLAFSIQRQRS